MRRRSLTLLVLAGTIVVLAAAGGIVAWHPWQKPVPAAEVEPPFKFVEISKFNQGLLQSIELISAAGTIKLDDAQGAWKIVTPAVLDVRKGPLADLLYSLTNLSSERVIEERPTNLALYGLDHPTVTVRMALTTGDVRELYLGNLTPAADSYYLMAKGDPRLFTVRGFHGSYMQYRIRDLWEGAPSPIDGGDIVYLRIAKQGKRLVELTRTEELYKSDIEYRNTTLSVVYPYVTSPKPVDLSSLTDFAKALGALQAGAAVDASPKDTSRYGLDRPAWELQIRDGKGTSLHVTIGKQEGQALFYQLEKDPAVYAGDPRLLTLLDVDPFHFVNKYAAILRLDYVDKVDISAGATRHQLSIQRATPGSEEGAKWLVDGHAVGVKAFKDFYQALISLQIDSFHEDPAGGTPEVMIEYFLNKGTGRKLTIGFVPYSQEFYAVIKNGKGDILVNRQQVKGLLQGLDALAASVGS